MKNIKKTCVIVLLAFALVLSLTDILPISENVKTVKAATKIKINEDILTLNVGDTYTLKMNDTKKSVKWESSKKSVATVSTRGKVDAKKSGSTVITAIIGSKKYICKVTVVNPTINIETSTLNMGHTLKLKVSDTKSNITWSSSNASVASVDLNGKVTAVNVGNANINALIGNKKYVCEVTVENPVDYIFYETDNGCLLDCVSSVPLGLFTATITFYDKDDYVLGRFVTEEIIFMKKDTHYVMGYEFKLYSGYSYYEVDMRMRSKYGHTDTQAEVADNNYSITAEEAIGWSGYAQQSILVHVKNTSAHAIYARAIYIVFYKDSIPVHFIQFKAGSVRGNETNNFMLSNYGDFIDYDNYKIYLTGVFEPLLQKK